MNPDSYPLRVFVPDDVVSPVEVYDEQTAFRIAIVERAHVGKLSGEWDRPAAYILVGVRTADGLWPVYVGKAPSGVKARLRQHARQKDNWERALVIIRDTTMGMNSAQIAWLEGRLYELFATQYPDAKLENSVQPGDKTLMAHDFIEGAVVPVGHCLRVLGFPATVAAGKKVKASQAVNVPSLGFVPEAPVRKRVGAVTFLDVVVSGILKPGTRLVSTNGSWPAEATVTHDGQLQVAGAVFVTPSAAGKHVKGGEVNGWTFWAVKQPDGALKTLVEYREEYRQKFH